MFLLLYSSAATHTSPVALELLSALTSPAVARLLILGGGLRGRLLAAEACGEGHAVRIVSRSGTRRADIEAVGAECALGDPNRLGTLRGVLEGVTVACWLLGTATGEPEQLRELHRSRLPAFLGQAIDSTVRGFLYEAPDLAAPPDIGCLAVATVPLAEGAQLVEDIARCNAIPAAALTADPRDVDSWLRAARAALSTFL
jgi:uncharacterized protein YbjT (DUF2867 family)